MRHYMKIALAILAIGIGLASGQVQQAITQAFPTVKVPPAPVRSHSDGQVFLESDCDSLVNGTSPPSGNGTIFFNCGTMPAFKVYNTNGSLTGAGIFTPIFTLPTGYTRLSYTVAGDIACTNIIASLAPETPVTIQVYSYSYCARYENVYNTTLASFSITWS